MGVVVQRHGDVCVAHDVLQRLGIHTGVCPTGTERVPLRYNKDKSENPILPRLLKYRKARKIYYICTTLANRTLYVVGL